VDTEDRRIAVSPRHEVLLAHELGELIERPPKRDFVVRTIMRRQANDLVLMLAELVIRKTYFPGQVQGDPEVEFANQTRASELIPIPPPIGWSATEIRSCVLPGQPYARLSPFGVEPVEMNIRLAESLSLATAAGLWLLAEQALTQLLALQEGGLSHGDAELHNCVVCPSPLELLLIDFGSAVRRDLVDAAAWEKRCALDLVPLLREAVFLQCALGRQRGPLADLTWQRMDGHFGSATQFRKRIEEQGKV
jgi:hypothetical protein